MTDSSSTGASAASASDAVAPANADTPAAEAKTARPSTGGPVTSRPTPSAAKPVFSERLYLPWYHWLLPLLAAGLLAAEVDMGYPGVRAWLPYVITFGLALLMLWRFSSATVVVRDGELWVGEAHLPLKFAGEMQIIPGRLKRQVLGPAFDPAAFALHRSWVGPMVWIHLTDENDPTPYWLISTRHPDELLVAIRDGQAAKNDET